MTALVAVHAAALCLVAADVCVRALRLRLLLPRARRPGWGAAVAANALGDAASAVTPARLGGEPARFLGLSRAGNGSGEIVAALAVERVVDLTMVGVVTAGLVLGARHSALGARHSASGWEGHGSWLILVGLLALVSFVAVWWRRRRRPRPATAGLREGLGALRELRLSTVARVSGLTLGSIVARVAMLPVLLFGAAGVEAGEAFLASFGLLYSQLVLPMPSGAGGVELGYVAWLAGRLAPETIASTLVLWRLYTIGPAALLAGGLWLHARRRRLRLSVAALVLVVLGVMPRSAAAQGSRIIPLDHWAYDEIRLLRERGLLDDLNPLAQPYRARELETALATIDADTLAVPAAEWVRALQRAFPGRPDPVRARWGVAAQTGAHASAGRRLDPLRHFGQEDVWPWWRAGAWLEHRLLAVETRLYGDTWLTDDPDGRDPGQRRGGRGDHAYLGVALSGFDLTIGRFARNWAPVGVTGLMVSDVATPYPQLGFDADLGPLRLQSFVGELDTIAGRKRYLAGHQVTWRHGDLVLAIGESILYSADGGSFNLRYLNPAEYLFFDADNEPDDLSINLVLDVRAWYRVGALTLLGEGVLDDISANRPRAPTRYAGRIEARWVPPASRVAGRLGYERVSSFAYRTNRPEDGYRYLDRGLGPNHADYDRLALTADVFPPVPGLRLSVGGQVLRQGEGDLRVPFPIDYNEFLAAPALHLGVVERTVRLRFAGRYRPSRFWWVRWDVGPNFITNRFHQDGVSDTTFGGVVDAGVRLDLPLRPDRGG